jgi:hypothetical protein
LFDTLANSALAREKIVRWLARFHPGMAVKRLSVHEMTAITAKLTLNDH